jgi:hypothetical protein
VWLERTKDAWYFDYLLKAILSAQIGFEVRLQLLLKLREKIQAYRGPFKNQADLVAAIDEAVLRESPK